MDNQRPGAEQPERFHEALLKSSHGICAQAARPKSKMDDDADGDASAIRVSAGGVEINVVHLRPEGKMRKHSDVDTAAKAKGKLVGRAHAIIAGT